MGRWITIDLYLLCSYLWRFILEYVIYTTLQRSLLGVMADVKDNSTVKQVKREDRQPFAQVLLIFLAVLFSRFLMNLPFQKPDPPRGYFNFNAKAIREAIEYRTCHPFSCGYDTSYYIHFRPVFNVSDSHGSGNYWKGLTCYSQKITVPNFKSLSPSDQLALIDFITNYYFRSVRHIVGLYDIVNIMQAITHKDSPKVHTTHRPHFRISRLKKFLAERELENDFTFYTSVRHSHTRTVYR